jgi:hypothetical protein
MEQAMNTAKQGRIQRAGKRKLQPAKASSLLNPAVLPLEELRQLVFEIILRDDIKPFLRRMVILLDSLKVGQINKVVQVARQSHDPAFTKLMSSLSDAVEEGELVAARITVFLAASYAYQESLDYYWELTSYLDRFRQDGNQ